MIGEEGRGGVTNPGHGGGSDHFPSSFLWLPDFIIFIVKILRGQMKWLKSDWRRESVKGLTKLSFFTCDDVRSRRTCDSDRGSVSWVTPDTHLAVNGVVAGLLLRRVAVVIVLWIIVHVWGAVWRQTHKRQKHFGARVSHRDMETNQPQKKSRNTSTLIFFNKFCSKMKTREWKLYSDEHLNTRLVWN